MGRPLHLLAAHALAACCLLAAARGAPGIQEVQLKGDPGGRHFDGIGVVSGGGGTSVLLKDYPEPQRGQILDLLYKPKFGASVSALLVEIPGDGNSTQGSMPSHMRMRGDLDYSRGYMWWLLSEAKRRNPRLSLDATAWSAPGWIGHGRFWSQEAADYYVKWLEGLRGTYGLELDAIGCRNEKGVSLDFAKRLRTSLDVNGFSAVKLHAFDNWSRNKFDFVRDLTLDEDARNSIDILSAHVLHANEPASMEVQELAARMGKPIWNTEDHVYLKGFDCALGIVECFNRNFIKSGATRVVNWYDIAGVYPLAPYSEDPAAVLARSPWSGHYEVREALWGYAHYGQFTEIGWEYIDGGCGELACGGSFVSMKSPTGGDYSIIVETKGAKGSQPVHFQTGGGLAPKPLCVWRSNANEQFIRMPDIQPVDGSFTIRLDPDSIYSISTTTGQQKGGFTEVPPDKPFPFPYAEDFESYTEPAQWGHLPRYTADVSEVFELAERPDKDGHALRQVISTRPISWAPEWLPYTILGDERWQDYEVAADIWIGADESAGVMGRVNHIGTGYGCVPKGYYLKLAGDGTCQLVVIRGKKDKKKPVGDAEQQQLIAVQAEEEEGGEKVLATTRIGGLQSGGWHKLKLRFAGTKLTGLVDGKVVLIAEDSLYPRGMAGLMAGEKDKGRFSRPWYDNLAINSIGGPAPVPTAALSGQTPIYNGRDVSLKAEN